MDNALIFRIPLRMHAHVPTSLSAITVKEVSIAIEEKEKEESQLEKKEETNSEQETGRKNKKYISRLL